MFQKEIFRCGGGLGGHAHAHPIMIVEHRRNHMLKIQNWAQQFYARLRRDEEGATAVEYAVMLAVILAVTAATLTMVGQQINLIWTNVLAMLTGIAGA